MTAAAYGLDGVRFAYPRSQTARPAFSLDLESLCIEPGETLALVGPNGSGKTTLLMIFAFLNAPDRGHVSFFGENPWADHESTLRARREVVFVTHHPYLFKGTVSDNMAFGLKVRGLPKEEWAGRIRESLALVELEGWEPRPTSGLSAGQIQRVALARALALRTKVLLLDEPTANIEAGLALRIEAVISEISRTRGTTVVFSTHNFSQASRLADDVLYLSEGKRVRFSHENCFSGMAETDGRRSWIEPRPGERIVFPGARTGHVMCVIDPSSIRLFAAGDSQAASGPNVFSGRVTRLEVTESDRALVRVGGGLTFRVELPLAEVEERGIFLSRPVLIKFAPEAVELVESAPQGNSHHD